MRKAAQDAEKSLEKRVIEVNSYEKHCGRKGRKSQSMGNLRGPRVRELENLKDG